MNLNLPPDGLTADYAQTPVLPVTTLSFRVTGKPIQQGSKKGFVVGKRAIIVDDNKALLKPWRAIVRDAAEQALSGRRGLIDAARVTIDFYMPRPKSVTRERPSVKPDIDKLVRAILDALTDAAVLKDDALVVSLHVEEWYADQPENVGVVLTVESVTP